MAPRIFDKNRSVVRARELRRTMSLPKGLLWKALRARPDGFKFRRQHPLAPYIADFYCPSARRVVEVDGESHSMAERPAHDMRRDEWLREEGLRILRIPASVVMGDMQSAVDAILVACRG